VTGRRPRLLDLFSGAGGAAMGYHRAGFDVTGIDVAPQPNYPFRFVQADALDYLTAHGAEFDTIHASPPCHDHTALSALVGHDGTGRLLALTRTALDATGRPWVIENVQGAKMRRDLTLCGELFGLAVIRHRYFELGGWTAPQPAHRVHRGRVAGWRHGEYFDGPYFAVHGDGGGKGNLTQQRAAMGIDWMTKRELAQSIPPAYAEYVGRALLSVPPRMVPRLPNVQKPPTPHRLSPYATRGKCPPRPESPYAIG